MTKHNTVGAEQLRQKAHGLGDHQSKLRAWLLWNSQSSEYKLSHPEPTKKKGI